MKSTLFFLAVSIVGKSKPHLLYFRGFRYWIRLLLLFFIPNEEKTKMGVYTKDQLLARLKVNA